MRIAILFHFCDQSKPSAVTEVEGAITNVMLPEVGDTVSHCDFEGNRFRARVVGRHFDYGLPAGEDVDGVITVVLSLQWMSMQ